MYCIVLRFTVNVNWSAIDNTISNELSDLIPQSFTQNYVTNVWVGFLVIPHQTRKWNTPRTLDLGHNNNSNSPKATHKENGKIDRLGKEICQLKCQFPIKVRWWDIPLSLWNLTKVATRQILATLIFTAILIQLALFWEIPSINYKILVCTGIAAWDSAFN